MKYTTTYANKTAQAADKASFLGDLRSKVQKIGAFQKELCTTFIQSGCRKLWVKYFKSYDGKKEFSTSGNYHQWEVAVYMKNSLFLS